MGPATALFSPRPLIFKPNFVCLLTNERYKTYKMGFSFSPLNRPRVWDLGVLGGQKFNFLNMVMWHIKLKGMSSRPGYTEILFPTIKLVTLGWGLRVKYHYIDFFNSVGICDGVPSNVFWLFMLLLSSANLFKKLFQ